METRGRIVVVGAGPGGMAATLALLKAGFDVTLLERAAEIRAAGNILNLWPPPQKVLRLIGVDTDDLGAPCHSTFRNAKGRLRADVRLSPEVEHEFGGGFIGLLRWGLYKRMIDAIPAQTLKLGHEVESLEDRGGSVTVHVAGRDPIETDVVVGADGLHSIVRKHLWGDQPIRHQNLHLVGGWLYDKRGSEGEGVISHNSTTQVSYTPIRHHGRWGYEWWVLEAFDRKQPPPEDLKAFCRDRAREFPPFVNELIEATPLDNMQRWEIRDRPPLRRWSKGRITLVGDAAHPTSPYAAYGAGMSIEDGYFLAHELAQVDVRDTPAVRGALQAFEERRKPHTAEVTETAYRIGRIFHHAPRSLRPLRDLVFDRTPFLQRMIGEKMPDHICSQLAEIDAVAATFRRPAKRDTVIA